jgi:hypothetical protein
VPGLACEAVPAPEEVAVEEQAPADPGAEGHEQHVVGTDRHAGDVLTPQGTGGVVVDPDGQPVSSRRRAAAGSSTTPGRFGAKRRFPWRSTSPGIPAPTATTSGTVDRSRRVVSAMAASTASPPVGGRFAVLGQDGAAVVDHHAEDLGAADVEAHGRCGRGGDGRHDRRLRAAPRPSALTSQ